MIVNRYPDDPIELQPFNNTFTRQKIWKWSWKVGFIPMNRKVIYDYKVWLQLGRKSATVGEQRKCIQLLVSDYEKMVKELTQMGFIRDVLDLQIEVAKP